MHELWLVDIASGRHERLPLPPLGELEMHGFDPQGNPMAFMADRLYVSSFEGAPVGEVKIAPHLKVVSKDEHETIVFEGQAYERSTLGEPALAHAYRLVKGRWKRIDTRSTFYGTHGLGVRVLEATNDLGPTPERMTLSMEAFTNISDETSLIARLPPSPAETQAVSNDEEAHPPSWGMLSSAWSRLEMPEGMLYVIRIRTWESTRLETPVYIQGPEGPVALPPAGIPDGSSIDLSARKALVLVTAGARARLYDLETGRLLASIDGKEELSFWPQPERQPPASREEGTSPPASGGH